MAGNHTFRATVVDNGEPGRNDQFGLQVTDPSGAIIADLTFDPITLSAGNIQVPHQSGHFAASAALRLNRRQSGCARVGRTSVCPTLAHQTSFNNPPTRPIHYSDLIFEPITLRGGNIKR